MISISPLASAAEGQVIYDPGGESLEVVQGDNFIIRHIGEWDNPAEDGDFLVVINWINYGNNPAENYTFVSASAYFDLNNDNVDDGQPHIPFDVTLSSTPGEDTIWLVEVDCPSESRDGQFNVDVILGAYGAKVPHIATSNHPLPEQLGGFLVGWESVYRDAITIKVREPGPVCGVEVTIDPQSQDGAPGTLLDYTVTVTNTGEVVDNYELTVTDDASWGALLDVNLLEDIAPDENRQTMVSVTVPSGAIEGELTVITVTATSQGDSNMSDFDTCTCTAHTEEAGHGVDVSISPSDQSAPAGTPLSYTVTVRNTGNVEDTYDLTVSGNTVPSWAPTVSPASLELGAEEDGEATLTVTIPSYATGGDSKWTTITAALRENTEVSDSATCWAHATALRMVDVSISPPANSAPLGENATFTVTVINTGNVEDTYDLTVSDDAVPSWAPSLSDNLLESIGPGEDTTTTLTVNIPENATDCTEDNITVTATSRADNTVGNSETCMAHCFVPPPPERGVQVSILPEDQIGLPEETLTFTVTVKNTGEAEDNYDLIVSDNAGWGATLAENLPTIPAGENRPTTVSVTVPSDAIENESTEITVVATSEGDPTKSDGATCTAQAKALWRVEVSISPGSKSGAPGETLTYTITVKNTGSIADTYTLSAVGEAGWSVSIEPTSLTLDAGALDTATLSVVVPPDAVEGTSTVDVSAISVGNPAVTDSDTCGTVVTPEPGGTPVELPLPLAISAFLIGAAILLAYLLRGRGKKAARRMVLRGASSGFR